MEAGEWTRDIVFYLIAGSLLVVFGLYGRITFSMAILFFSLYGLYFVVVISVRVVLIF
jgi:Ca2+/Na+ antiporter